ncbi:hypothetical protein PsorP6_012681 [Peronosclerospora sorghi]|uniref:Uncharacterized protein n=1 Tax=Peronosclerospora sorghi TaxID=230839 RepID=A0ACC0WH75_9STRA|nr:hypothetical protein PsorP6_012681 [Peronosclerospora sorghi]
MSTTPEAPQETPPEEQEREQWTAESTTESTAESTAESTEKQTQDTETETVTEQVNTEEEKQETIEETREINADKGENATIPITEPPTTQSSSKRKLDALPAASDEQEKTKNARNLETNTKKTPEAAKKKAKNQRFFICTTDGIFRSTRSCHNGKTDTSKAGRPLASPYSLNVHLPRVNE